MHHLFTPTLQVPYSQPRLRSPPLYFTYHVLTHRSPFDGLVFLPHSQSIVPPSPDPTYLAKQSIDPPPYASQI